MNTSLFSENDVFVPRAYQNNQHAREQEKHWAHIAAEWRTEQQEPVNPRPNRMKVLFSRLLGFLEAPSGQLAIDNRL
jgi:hypothetical protein